MRSPGGPRGLEETETETETGTEPSEARTQRAVLQRFAFEVYLRISSATDAHFNIQARPVVVPLVVVVVAILVLVVALCCWAFCCCCLAIV